MTRRAADRRRQALPIIMQSSGGFTPPTTNLVADWDVAHATLSGGLVTVLPDQSGNGHDATSVVGHEPTYVASSANFNGRPAASFLVGGAVPRMTFGDVGLSSGGPASIYIVAISDGAAANRRVLSTTNGDVDIYHLNTNFFWVSQLSNNFAGITSDNLASTAAVLLSTVTGGTQRFYVSSVTEEDNIASSGVVFSGGGMLGVYAGAPNDAFLLNGEIARVLIYSAVHDLTTRTTVMNGLKTLYGIA